MNGKVRTREDYLIWRKENETRVTEAFELIEEEISNLFSPSKYISFLQYIEKFHQYSYQNLLLLFRQCPHATSLAGFKVWQDLSVLLYQDSNRKVIKEAFVQNGLLVLAPYTQKLLNKANPEMSTSQLIYNAVRLFDVSQTNQLPPLSRPKDIREEFDCNVALDTIREYTNGQLIFSSNPVFENDQHAFYDHNSHRIVIQQGVSPMIVLCDAINALVEFSLKPYIINENKIRLFISESITYVLWHHFGLDCTKLQFSYVSYWKNHSIENNKDMLHIIQTLAHNLINCLDENYFKLYEEQQKNFFVDDIDLTYSQN